MASELDGGIGWRADQTLPRALEEPLDESQGDVVEKTFTGLDRAQSLGHGNVGGFTLEPTRARCVRHGILKSTGRFGRRKLAETLKKLGYRR
jgi:hypothetical protein